MKNKGYLIGILTVIVLFLILVTYLISKRLSENKPVSPNSPESTPLAASCKEECPGSDGVLRSCHPKDSDGTSNESLCNRTGRIETCGPDYTEYCCNGKKWTKDMSACTTDTPTPTATQTPSPTVTPGLSAVCESVYVYAKKTDGTYSTIAMTSADLKLLKIGDTVRLKVVGSKDGVKSRFRITIGGVVESPEWRYGLGTIGSQYYDYKITKEGSIKFEGQVSTNEF